jgi:fructose-1,6-bisphosphatase
VNTKDFNILGLKIDSSNQKKDISFVSDINAYVQKIENVCRMQKGEIPSSINLGVDYYAFIFDPISNKSTVEDNVAVGIKSGIKEIKQVSARVVYYTDTKIVFEVTFSLNFRIPEKTTTCRIEVDIV